MQISKHEPQKADTYKLDALVQERAWQKAKRLLTMSIKRRSSRKRHQTLYYLVLLAYRNNLWQLAKLPFHTIYALDHNDYLLPWSVRSGLSLSNMFS